MTVKEVLVFVCLMGISTALSIKNPTKESDIVTMEEIQKTEARLFPKGDHQQIAPPERSLRVRRHLFKKKKANKGRTVIVNRYYSRRRPGSGTGSSEEYYSSRPEGQYHGGSSGERYGRPPTGGNHGGSSGERYGRPPSGSYHGGTNSYYDRRSSEDIYAQHENIFGSSSQRVDYGDGGYAHYGGDEFNSGRPRPLINHNIQTLPRPLRPPFSQASQGQDEANIENDEGIFE